MTKGKSRGFVCSIKLWVLRSFTDVAVAIDGTGAEISASVTIARPAKKKEFAHERVRSDTAKESLGGGLS